MDCLIKAKFWTDERVELLTSAQKLSLVWLMTNQARDIAGFVHNVTPRRFEFETNAKFEDLQTACQALPESFQALENNSYFVTNFIHHNFSKGGKISTKNNVIRAVLRACQALPEPFQALFFSAYPELQETYNEIQKERTAAEALHNPFPRGKSRSKSKSKSFSSSQNTDPIDDENADPIRATPLTPAERILAEALVAAYPRKYNYGDSLRQAKACLLREADRTGDPQLAHDNILAGIEAIKSSIATWTESEKMQFIKQPPAFFAQDHWKDDPTEWLSRRERQRPEPSASTALGGRKAAAEITL